VRGENVIKFRDSMKKLKMEERWKNTIQNRKNILCDMLFSIKTAQKQLTKHDS